MLSQLSRYFLKPRGLDSQDEGSIDHHYKYWRMRIFSSMYCGYVVYYFTRKSFTFAMPALIDELGYSTADLGFLASVMYISYGISKFFSGILSDRCNPRYVMSIGLLLTGVSNICFGASSSLVAFALFWGLNGLFQGLGFPPVAKQLTYWFSKKERGLWWSLMSTANNLGGAVIPLLIALIISNYSWRLAMYIPALISLVMGFILLLGMRGVPASLGLPCVEVYKKEPNADVDQQRQPQASTTLEEEAAPSLRQLLLNPAILLLAVSSFFVYVVRSGVNDWFALYLSKGKGYSLLEGAGSITWFEVGGFIGSFASGWASDRFFHGNRVPFLAFCSLVLCLSVFGLWISPGGFLFLDCLLLAITGFCIFATQSLVGLASAEVVGKRAACTAYGITGGISYLGAAVSGYPLGKIIELWAWQGFFFTLLFCATLKLLALLPLLKPKVGTAPTPSASLALGTQACEN